MAAQVREATDNEIKLLKDEAGGLMYAFGICTISFYKGDFAAASAALRQQLGELVAANPWLAGRLVKAQGGVCLRHSASPTSSDVDELFKTSSAGDAKFKFTPNTPYAEICTSMYKAGNLIVGSGSSLLGKKKPVAILTLAESAPGEFALIFSLSHAVGDGRTYYEIFQMLQPGAPVRELATTREMSFSESMRDMCGRKELAWADSAPAICMYLPLMLGCGKKVKSYAFHLDTERLAAAKAAGAEKGGVPYVTTNDILTSGFFNVCGTRLGWMGIDCRGKMPGIEKDMAGNYVSALMMDPDTFASPATVRTMMSSTPYKTTMRPLPSCCKWTCGMESANFAMVTNWSSFAGSLVELEGCELVIHLPVRNPAEVMCDEMIPFASGPGKVGVICWTCSSDEEGLREALPVGECVSKALFP